MPALTYQACLPREGAPDTKGISTAYVSIARGYAAKRRALKRTQTRCARFQFRVWYATYILVCPNFGSDRRRTSLNSEAIASDGLAMACLDTTTPIGERLRRQPPSCRPSLQF